ncbi:unnamed protein product [Linum trigynum]|uniref:Uncharacterized protein n=1 Tax=Linum trigynum TaxID=586398 RepID=A0AAV2F948_9ROSI
MTFSFADRKAREKKKDEVDLLILRLGWKIRTTNRATFSFSSSTGKYKRRKPSVLGSDRQLQGETKSDERLMPCEVLP